MTNVALLPVDCRPKAIEWIAVLAMLALMFLLSLWTLPLYPVVWADDILWTEPAINLVRTGQFTTSVFQLQPAGTFWAAQSPLYPLVLSVWLRVAGFSLTAIKSFNLILVTVAAFLVWLGSWKYRLVQRPSIRLLIVPLLLLGYGMSFAYRSSRPDVAGLISLLMLWLAFSVPGQWKFVLIFIAAALTPWVGVQVGLYAFWACLMARLTLGGKLTTRELILVAAGIGFGACSLLFFYYVNGALQYFLGSILQAANEHAHWGRAEGYLGSVPRRLKAVWSSYLMDFSLWPLGVVLAYLLWQLRRCWNHRAKKAVFCLLAIFATVPFVFNFTGHFAFYYAYMLYVPMVLALLVAHDVAIGTPAPGHRLVLLNSIFFLAVLAAALVGLPLRLVLSSSFCHIVPRGEYLEAIRAHVHPADVVFCDYPAFFEAKQVAAKVYSPMYSKHFVTLAGHAHDFSAEEKQQITVLIIRPEHHAELEPYFGGEWVGVSPPFGDSLEAASLARVPLLGSRLVRHFQAPQMARYQLQIFRRTRSTASVN